MKRFLSVLLSLFTLSGLYARDISIVTSPAPNYFPIVGSDGVQATFVIDSSDAEVVNTAAEAVIGDINLITGKNLSLANDLKGIKYPVIAGTIGSSHFIDNLASTGKIDTSDIAGKWEAYGLETVDNPAEGIEKALVIYGSTPRGTAYGLFELSKLMGVSPYVWWADVLPEKREALYATPGKSLTDEPSVKFRGIFINDEDWGLMPWAAQNMDPEYANIGPNTYAKVMELLLRLRANTLWPAMHPCSQAFWDNKANIPIAQKYDITLGSSHCEQMLRNNVWEWGKFENNSGTNENWNYVTNKDMVQRYWEERVKESKGIPAMYTLGMRGVHDSGFSGYPTTEDKVRGLTEIIGFQRGLIEKHLGEPSTIPQVFIPYKEVLEAYNAGLQVPEDVTLVWVDDNHGYIRQLPTTKEQQREGGHGIYYHISYWGSPSDYLWISSISPSLISYELVKAYNNGVRDLWILNVGDIKPAEEELEFFMDMAWDIDKWQPEDAYKYTRHWAAETFGENLADAISDIKLEYYQLAAAGKPEHVHLVNYTAEEMDNRINRYAALTDKVDSLSQYVTDRLQDAFFELIEYPVKGAYNMNKKIFRAKQSIALAGLGEKEKAAEYSSEAQEAYNNILALTDKYNKQIASGKWNGIMDYKPRNLKQFDMPVTAATNDGSVTVEIPASNDGVIINADEYVSARGSFKNLKNLGISNAGVTVWPLNMTSYNDNFEAPYLEYKVPVKEGLNKIEARFLPTFPIHDGGYLNVGISVDNEFPQRASLKTKATEGKWKQTVLQGYNDATVNYIAKKDGEIPVKIFMLDPGIVLSDIRVNYHYDSIPEDEPLIYRFDFTDPKVSKARDGFIRISADDRYSPEKGYGYDFSTDRKADKNAPYFFSVDVPDGNYLVTAVIGDKRSPGETTLRAESRRLFYENVPTAKNEFKTCTFVVNKRNTKISDNEFVKVRGSETYKLNWDDKLTIEINGETPQLAYLEIEKVDDIPTIFLCGDSTVVDQDNEPWASWGQMITRFFTDEVSFANYAESGRRADSFIDENRLKKILTQAKPDDWIFIEFGHNDQKIKGPGKGAFYSYMTLLKEFIDEARARGMHPVLVTPTSRRSFNNEGKIVNTHEDYPDAMRFLGERENVTVIELNDMTRTLYEALGVEGSKNAFVHYPAGTYPGQDKDLKDNTHFNTYGAYQVAKCVIEGMKAHELPLVKYLREDYVGYDPAHPDSFESFHWNNSPFTKLEKPEGN